MTVRLSRHFTAFIITALAAVSFVCAADENKGTAVAAGTRSARVGRIKAVLTGSEEVRRAVAYVSDNCELMIPADRSLDGLDGKIHCSFTVDSTGSITTAWITKGLIFWLDRAIADAILKLPAWDGLLRKNDRSARHDMVFTFTSRQGIGYIDPGTVTDSRRAAMTAQIQQYYEKQGKELTVRARQWNRFRTDNMVESITAEHKKALRGGDAALVIKNPALDDLRDELQRVEITVSTVIE